MSLQEFKPVFFTVQDRDSIMVATVTRPTLCEEDNIEQFGVELNQLIGYGTYFLVLDLGRVTLMTSSAIGKLIGVHRNLHRHEGRLVLCGVEGLIHRVLASAKLIDYFHISPSVDEAVEQLKKETTEMEPSTVAKPR